MNEAANEPWVVQGSVEMRAEIAHRESPYGETPAEGDRTVEGERLRAPARSRRTRAKPRPKKERSESEQA